MITGPGFLMVPVNDNRAPESLRMPLWASIAFGLIAAVCLMLLLVRLAPAPSPFGPMPGRIMLTEATP
jgi:hypothetical protein